MSGDGKKQELSPACKAYIDFINLMLVQRDQRGDHFPCFAVDPRSGSSSPASAEQVASCTNVMVRLEAVKVQCLHPEMVRQYKEYLPR